MSDFSTALANTLTFEGGYANNALDLGGETYAGVSRKDHPTWAGWPIVEKYKAQHPNLVDLNRALMADSQLQGMIGQFYRDGFWHFDDVTSQPVADKLFDMFVNFGPQHATQITQHALAKLGYRLSQDGVWGDATMTAVNKEKEADMLQFLRAYCSLYRVHRVLQAPDQITFIEDWLIRDAK